MNYEIIWYACSAAQCTTLYYVFGTLPHGYKTDCSSYHIICI